MTKKKNKKWKLKLEFDTSQVSKSRIAEIIFQGLSIVSDQNESEAEYRQKEFSHVWDVFFNTLIDEDVHDFDSAFLEEIYSKEED